MSMVQKILGGVSPSKLLKTSVREADGRESDYVKQEQAYDKVAKDISLTMDSLTRLARGEGHRRSFMKHPGQEGYVEDLEKVLKILDKAYNDVAHFLAGMGQGGFIK